MKIIAIFDAFFLADAIIDNDLTFSQELFQTKCVRRPTAQMIAIFSDFCNFEIKPDMRDVLAKMRDVLAKMRECGK